MAIVRQMLVVLCALLATACVEMVRWQDETPRRPEPEPVVSAPPADGHYVVKAGDTVYSIAFRNQMDFRELATWNDIGPNYLIRPGQVLRLAPSLIDGSAGDSSPIMTFPAEPAVTAGTAEEVAASPVAPTSFPPPVERPAPGRWLWPTAGAVIRNFGAGTANGTSKGLIIAGALGQPVVAAAPGKVVYSGSALKGYGELIIIKHDDVFLSAYGYNRRRLVAEGAEVATGQPIAELGLGPEQRPVLHFEIREKGKPVNPAPLLSPR